MNWNDWEIFASDESHWTGIEEKGLLKAKYVKDYVLRLWFEEGTYFSVYDLDWEPLLIEVKPNSVLLPLQDIQNFKNAKGKRSLIWPNPTTGKFDADGIDLAPECVRFFCEQYGTRIQPRDLAVPKDKQSAAYPNILFPIFPSKDDWDRIAQSYQLQRIDVQRDFYRPEGNGSRRVDWDVPLIAAEAREWIKHLHHRVLDIRMSYIMMSFYFEQDIPDKGGYKPPEFDSHGQYKSEEFFSHFTDSKHQIKYLFDYHAKACYSNLFSAIENIGKILKVLYGVEMRKRERVSFSNIAKKMEAVAPKIGSAFL